MKFKTLLLRTLALPAVVLTLTCFNSALAQRLNLNFNSAKGYLFRITSKLDEPKTVYCSCDITITKKWYYPNLESCGYIIQYSNPKRAKRIEAEHIVPASYFGKTRECWLKKSGRQNCENTDTCVRHPTAKCRLRRCSRLPQHPTSSMQGNLSAT